MKKSSTLYLHKQQRLVKLGDIMLTEKMVKDLKSLRSRKVNLSDKDAPEITHYEKAVVGKFYRAIKKKKNS